MKGRKLLIAVMLLFPLIFAQGQQLIKGRVTTEETNEGLPGVNILVKGSVNGTTTDNNGNYSLQASPGEILVFSFIGYSKEEIAVSTQTVIDVTLSVDVSTLSEVIVVGYGTQKKSDVLGSIGSVKPKDFEQLPLARTDQALQGRVAGVMVQNNDASPNANTTIRIRGYSSINGGNNPLVVIDGLQGGNLSTLNPSDIESIEVLKDASSTAIYGSRGAGGVILVTTKSGKSGAPVVTYNTFFSQSRILKKLDLMNASQYAQTVNENRVESGASAPFTAAEIEAFSQTGGTDWQDAIFQKGFAQNHNLSVSGGNNYISYYIAGNMMNQKGIIRNSSYARYSLRSNVKAHLSKKLSVGMNLFLASEADHPTTLNTFAGENGGSPIFSALLWAPTKSIHDTDGKYTQPGGGVGPKTNYNPVALAEEPVKDNFNTVINATGNVEYEVLDGLKLTVLGSYQSWDSEHNEYVNSLPTGNSGTEYAGIVNRRSLSLLNTNMVTYEREMNKHALKFTGVFEQQYEEYNGSFAGSKGFFINSISYNNLGLGQNPLPLSSDRSERSLLSYMGRINYSFNNKYLLTLTARADGSSVFGEDNKWGYFPSAAVGWNIGNENFMRDVQNIISSLKLRGSYGVVGNQAVPPYGSLSTLNTDSQYLLNGSTLNSGASFDQAPNPDLKWERSAQIDVGLDAELFEGRIDLSADYYVKRTTDLLFNVSLPKVTGYKSQLRNVGEVENKGFELYLGGKPLVGKLKWESGFTFAVNRNKVLALADGADDRAVKELQKSIDDIVALPGFTNSFWLEVGQPIAVFRGFQYEGVWKTEEAAAAAVYGTIPGAPKYKDVDGDHDIDEDDFITIGNAMPKFTYGWNNNVSYKNFDLNVFVQGVHGNKIYNLSRVRTEMSTGDSDATSTRLLNRWTPENQNTQVPSFTGSSAEPVTSSRWLEDGSYLRIKNIALGYKLASRVLNALKISSCRLYVSGTNLFTFTDYTGFDPEASAQTDSKAGVDLSTYPSQKIFTVGLDLKF